MFSSIDPVFVKNAWERCGLPENFADVQPEYPEFMRFANEILQRAYDSESRAIIVRLPNGDGIKFPHNYQHEVDHGVLHIIGGLPGQSSPIASYGTGAWVECDRHSETAFSLMSPANPVAWEVLVNVWTIAMDSNHANPPFEVARQIIEFCEQEFLKANS